MATYQKFLIRETDHFDPAKFPTLQTDLQRIVVQLNREPQGPKAEMLLSFVKDHCINSQYVVEHPAVATLISTKSLPTGDLEELFASSRSNPAFTKGLEAYIHACLSESHLY